MKGFIEDIFQTLSLGQKLPNTGPMMSEDIKGNILLKGEGSGSGEASGSGEPSGSAEAFRYDSDYETDPEIYEELFKTRESRESKTPAERALTSRFPESFDIKSLSKEELEEVIQKAESMKEPYQIKRGGCFRFRNK